MNSQRQFVLGVFFVVALSILAFYTLFLTDFSLFREPIRMTVDFPDAHALRDGDPVLVAGKRIGRVKQIDFRPAADPGRRIRVEMHLDQPIEILEGYTFTIEESTFLGGRNIDIDPGPFGGPPAERDVEGVYLGRVKKNPLAALESVGELVANNSAAVTNILDGLDDAITAVLTGDGLLNKVLYDTDLAADASAAVRDLRATSADLRETIAETRYMVEAIQRGEGTLGRLLGNDTLYRETLATVESLRTVARDLEEGKGVVGALLHDDALAVQLRQTVTDVSALARGLANGEGLLGRVLKDEVLAAEIGEMVTSFARAGTDLREIAATLRGTEGSLGRLLNDPALYDEALTALKVLTRSLEDYRESAPVSAFTGAIFGAL